MWINTNSGKVFSFDNINPDSICLEDIAHALSYQCRYNGHCHMFYSTAEHCLNIADYICRAHANAEGKAKDKAKKMAAQALLHDAAEAYVGDMPGPFKALMPEFDRYEKELMGVIFTKYGLRPTLYKEVKEYDTRILLNEKSALFPKSFPKWEMEHTLKPLEDIVIHGYTPTTVYPLYLKVLKGVFGEGV